MNNGELEIIESDICDLECMLKDGEKIKDRIWEILSLKYRIQLIARKDVKTFKLKMVQKYPLAMKAIRNFKED